jgi:hypothetical protein
VKLGLENLCKSKNLIELKFHFNSNLFMQCMFVVGLCMYANKQSKLVYFIRCFFLSYIFLLLFSIVLGTPRYSNEGGYFLTEMLILSRIAI